MAALEFFTVTGNGVAAVGIDYVDVGSDPDSSFVYAFVDFVPRLPKGTVIWASGLDVPRGIQLDTVRARFDGDGVLRTITGNAVDEKQRIAVTATTFTVSMAGVPTATLTRDTTTAFSLQTALEGLSTIGVGNVFVTGLDGGPNFTVNFRGALAHTELPQMTATNATVTTLANGTLDSGVKLVANTAVLDLDDLIYDVVFSVPFTTRFLNPFAFAAPTVSGATVDLASVAKLAPKTAAKRGR
jgi:hypothetical protein